MTAPTIHFAVECQWPWSDVRACCGYDIHREKQLTDDPALVTCSECRKLCGFDEQLTEVHGDPLLNRRAA